MSNDNMGGPAWPKGWKLHESEGEYVIQNPQVGGVVIGPPENGSSIAEAILYLLLRDTHDAMLAERAKRAGGES